MSAYLSQIVRAQRRLNANLFFEQLALGVAAGAVGLALAVIVGRTFGVHWPLWASLGGAGLVAAVVTIAGVALRRANRLRAALALDEAAGLKERLSSALTIAASADPFSQAALRDAEQHADRVHLPTQMPLRAPRLWPWSIAGSGLAALAVMFMPTLKLFAADPVQDAADSKAVVKEREAVTAAVNQQINKIKEMAEGDKSLEALAKDLKPLDLVDKPTRTPEDVRREAIKKIDQIASKLEQKQSEQNSEAQRELKRMLAGLKPELQKSGDNELTQSLAKGDFQGAKKNLQDVKKQLEDAARKGDAEAQKKIAEIQKKLEDLSKQLDKLADNKQLQKELENKAGLSEEAAKKLLEQVQKMDPKDVQKALEKALADSKLTPEQLKQLAQKIAQNKQAQEACKQLAQAMQQAAQQCQKPGGEGEGQDGQQSSGLDAAMGQLSDMEMAEQMMNELEGQLAELGELREGICQGNKPGKKNDEIGQQGGQEGLGYGARIGEEKSAHKLKPTKEKTQRQGGEIIGQMLVDGPQLKGEAQAEVRAAISSELRDASDAIERDEVPRQYERVLRVYFDSLAGLARPRGADAPAPPPSDNAPAEEPAEEP